MKYWVFDLDGTLVDSLTTHFEVMKTVFKKFDCSFDDSCEQEILKLSANSLPDYFLQKFGNDSNSALHYFRSLTSDSIQRIQPFSKIPELLDLLSSKRVGLAIWTAREMEVTRRILENTGLSKYFSLCVSGTCVQHGKPHPEGLQKISQHFQCKPNEMIMVGDFDSDMLGAQEFGAVGIRVLWHPVVVAKDCTISHKQFHRVEDFISWVSDLVNPEKAFSAKRLLNDH